MTDIQMMPDPYPSKTAGRFTARALGGGNVELIRSGGPGKGPTLRTVLLGREDVQQTLEATSARAGAEARDQANVLRWALMEASHG